MKFDKKHFIIAGVVSAATAYIFACVYMVSSRTPYDVVVGNYPEISADKYELTQLYSRKNPKTAALAYHYLHNDGKIDTNEYEDLVGQYKMDSDIVKTAEVKQELIGKISK